MGYGVYEQGSGIAATRYLAESGAHVLVTDMGNKEVLHVNAMKLSEYKNITWKLGIDHDEEDFKQADIVVKNPGVSKDSPYLKHAKAIETDISLFLQEYTAMQKYNNYSHKLIGVTGSKGKSSVVSLLYHLLNDNRSNVYLAGNITISPLFYLEDLAKNREATLILELSSWQLGDLMYKKLLKTDVALLTNLMEDHQSYYDGDMKAYALDKLQLFLDQSQQSYALFDIDDIYTPYFVSYSLARHGFYTENCLPSVYDTGCYWIKEKLLAIRINKYEEEIKLKTIPVGLLRSNVAKAIMIAKILDKDSALIVDKINSYKGLDYRCQIIAYWKQYRFINDSAATIPQATIRAIETFYEKNRKLVVILGGSDKGSDLSVLRPWIKKLAFVYLLPGTAYEAYECILEDTVQGSYVNSLTTFKDIVHDFLMRFFNESADLLLSPGVASFGLFTNEFDRGRSFSEAVISSIKV